MAAFLMGPGNSVFTLRQDGSSLTGSVEGTNVGFTGGNDVPVPITEGKIDGDRISFKAGSGTYEGTLKGEQIELQPSVKSPFKLPDTPKKTVGGPAIGPPPDGSDPSISNSRRSQKFSLVLHRVKW
jgi:beta-galactosidase